jgi:hypothetical protein
MKAKMRLSEALNQAENEACVTLIEGKWYANLGLKAEPIPCSRQEAYRSVRGWQIDRALQLIGVEDDADPGDIDPNLGYWRDTVRSICKEVGIEFEE